MLDSDGTRRPISVASLTMQNDPALPVGIWFRPSARFGYTAVMARCPEWSTRLVERASHWNLFSYSNELSPRTAHAIVKRASHWNPFSYSNELSSSRTARATWSARLIEICFHIQTSYRRGPLASERSCRLLAALRQMQ